MNECKIALERPEHKQVRIQDEFWNRHLDKIHTITVWDILNKFEHDHDEGIMKNYEWVCEGQNGKHIGDPWYDGLICEVIRGISDIIAVSYDEKLDQKIEYYASMISKAQDIDPDGYINTYTSLICPEQRWGEHGGSLLWQHETYNIGCLVEAGIHYYKATGKTVLLKCSVKAANCMCSVMGPEPRKNIVPAHSLAEEAIVKLYRLFVDIPELADNFKNEYGIEVIAQHYLDLAQFWMDHRGVHHNRASFPRYMGEYSQDHCPITEQSEAVGHAVRAALMYTGLTALGIETGSQKYLDASKRIWDNVEQTKLHINGGIGAIHNEERFGYQYDLPNDAYLETCAGVALAFWAGEMHRAFGDAKYIDVFERTLYNNVLPSLSVDGTHYFYENPLISDGTLERWNWHRCPCCPPMFLKLMGCFQDYIYSISNDGIYINLHIGSVFNGTVHGKPVTIEQSDCTLPWNGTNKITVHLEEMDIFTLAIRVPEWSGEFNMKINSEIYNEPNEKGYILLTREWKDGDIVHISMELPVMKIQAHPYVDADAGRIALQRGPVLYCMEEIDNPDGIDIILGQDEIHTVEMDLSDLVIGMEGRTAGGKDFKAIPYYLWNNRGMGKMIVWIRQQDQDMSDLAQETQGFELYVSHCSKSNIKKLDLTNWDGKLYRRYVDK